MQYDTEKRSLFFLLFLAVSAVFGLCLLGARNFFFAPRILVTHSQIASHEGVSKSSPVININKAGASELMRLPGIGRKMAEEIIDYRKAHGYFVSKEDIKKIPGVGEKKYEKLKDLITLE